MKTLILNGSPRKNWNTAQMLKSAQKGAESTRRTKKKCTKPPSHATSKPPLPSAQN